MDGGAWKAAVHGVAESGTTEQLHFDFSLSCTGEGNGNPLQCSCLGNPRDGGAWWAAVYGVAQTRTRLKRLSSSSSSSRMEFRFSETRQWTAEPGSSLKGVACSTTGALIQSSGWQVSLQSLRPPPSAHQVSRW